MDLFRGPSLAMTLTLELVLMLVSRTCEGTFYCLCTTPECQSRDDIICRTDSLCYVQYMPSPQDTPSEGGRPPPPLLVHGCIDTRTALLCENQRPKFYSGSWPVMYCCSGSLCNKDVVPTLPPWGSNLQDGSNYSDDSLQHSQQHPEFDEEEKDESVTQTETDEDYRTDDDSQWRISVNPLYIGVPVAGACVLLAIIVFAIYILRRQNQIYEEQYIRTYAKSRPPYIYQDGCRYVAMVTRGGQPFLARCHNGCLYAESEGSSNGSESRLLAHV